MDTLTGRLPFKQVRDPRHVQDAPPIRFNLVRYSVVGLAMAEQALIVATAKSSRSCARYLSLAATARYLVASF